MIGLVPSSAIASTNADLALSNATAIGAKEMRKESGRDSV